MGTVIELTNKASITVEEDLLTVSKMIKENQFVTCRKKHSPHTVIINRDKIILLQASVD
jgi:hypothetical protein